MLRTGDAGTVTADTPDRGCPVMGVARDGNFGSGRVEDGITSQPRVGSSGVPP